MKGKTAVCICVLQVRKKSDCARVEPEGQGGDGDVCECAPPTVNVKIQ